MADGSPKSSAGAGQTSHAAHPLIARTRDVLHRVFAGAGVTGVYATYEAAVAAAPKGSPIGYDHTETSNLYSYLLDYTKISDYAALFYLSRLLQPGSRLFDFGGNTGVLYYSYQRRWALPPGAHWTVCDVPAVVRAGEEFARNRPSEGLAFTSRFEDAAGADLLFTSGTLQYVPKTLPALLAPLGDAMPRRVLVNRTALWPGETFYTLQPVFAAHCPYRVQNRVEFVSGMEALGYRICDEWECPESAIHVRWHPRHRIDRYLGMLLERTAA